MKQIQIIKNPLSEHNYELSSYEVHHEKSRQNPKYQPATQAKNLAQTQGPYPTRRLQKIRLSSSHLRRLGIGQENSARFCFRSLVELYQKVKILAKIKYTKIIVDIPRIAWNTSLSMRTTENQTGLDPKQLQSVPSEGFSGLPLNALGSGWAAFLLKGKAL